jgi:hypothetical protein
MSFTYTEKLAGYTAGVFVVVGIMCTTAVWGKKAAAKHHLEGERRKLYEKRVQDVMINAIIVFLFIIFPSISYIGT